MQKENSKTTTMNIQLITNNGIQPSNVNSIVIYNEVIYVYFDEVPGGLEINDEICLMQVHKVLQGYCIICFIEDIKEKYLVCRI